MGGDDRDASSAGLVPPAGRPGPVLGSLGAVRGAVAWTARPRQRLVGRLPRCQHRQGVSGYSAAFFHMPPGDGIPALADAR